MQKELAEAVNDPDDWNTNKFVIPNEPFKDFKEVLPENEEEFDYVVGTIIT